MTLKRSEHFPSSPQAPEVAQGAKNSFVSSVLFDIFDYLALIVLWAILVSSFLDPIVSMISSHSDAALFVALFIQILSIVILYAANKARYARMVIACVIGSLCLSAVIGFRYEPILSKKINNYLQATDGR